MLRGAIDLHCHLLPGMDDGARDLDDAIAMVRQAQVDGIQAICATPHIRHDHDVRINELPARLTDLVAAVDDAGLDTRILSGAEVAATALGGLDQDELRALTLGGSGRWILLEPPPGPLDQQLETAVRSLDERGFRAVIAHPERHLVADLVGQLRRLIDRGALVQATAAFLIDDKLSAGMLELARAGVIHLLGSDSHSSTIGRRVELGPGLRALSTVEPARSHLQWIAAIAPQSIVAGAELRPPF